MKSIEWFCATLGVCAGLLITVMVQGQLSELRAANAMLESQLQEHRQDRAALNSARTLRTTNAQLQEQLKASLAVHEHWNWDRIVHSLLQPFALITPSMIDAAVRTCYDNGTMYCLRAQISQGKLYITDYRAIFFDRYFAPSRVLPLLETLRQHPGLPDVDLVIAAVDEPRIKTLVHPKEWTRLCARYPAGHHHPVKTGDDQLPPPLFSSTVNRAHLDLPWLDFGFFLPRKEHKLRTPPWSIVREQILQHSQRIRWEDKVELAMHTGNVGSPFRKRLAKAAAKAPSTMLVNELFIGDHKKIKHTCEEIGKHRTGGFQQHLCYMTPAQQCSYKYLLQTASIGYANKFKCAAQPVAHVCPQRQ
jgi:hypothetical protein